MASRDLNRLHPLVKQKAKKHVELCKEHGISLLIYCTLRTYQEQDALYALGRTQKGNKVTWAKSGQSFHNFGCAYDCVAVRNGKAVWTSSDPVWQKIGELGKQCGLEWGGDWPAKKKDRPHFQYTGGLSIKEIKKKFETGEDLFPMPVTLVTASTKPEVPETSWINKIVDFIRKFV